MTVSPIPGLGMVPARVWYTRPVLAVARDLMNTYISVAGDDGVVTIRLTEVEAYAGAEDPASHAFRGRNSRNAAMFAEPGRLYVYRHLGLHNCVNVVAESTGRPAAVLLRAGEVVEGTELAWARRAAVGRVDTARQLARGPGRLAVCLGLGLADNGADVTESAGRVVVDRRNGGSSGGFATGARVGVAGPGGDPVRYPWRIWLAGDPTVSAFRPGYRSPASPTAPGGAATSA